MKFLDLLDQATAITSELRAELNSSRGSPKFINSAVKFIAESLFARAS